jgi:hypothetical protein
MTEASHGHSPFGRDFHLLRISILTSRATGKIPLTTAQYNYESSFQRSEPPALKEHELTHYPIFFPINNTRGAGESQRMCHKGGPVFVELMPLLAGRTVLITVAKVDDKTIRVNVIPALAKADENPALTTPLTYTGPPEELDAELGKHLAGYVQTHQQRMV